jgi:hypothetical protein
LERGAELPSIGRPCGPLRTASLIKLGRYYPLGPDGLPLTPRPATLCVLTLISSQLFTAFLNHHQKTNLSLLSTTTINYPQHNYINYFNYYKGGGPWLSLNWSPNLGRGDT